MNELIDRLDEFALADPPPVLPVQTIGGKTGMVDEVIYTDAEMLVNVRFADDNVGTYFIHEIRLEEE